MIIEERNVFKSSRNKLLTYLLNVLDDNTHIIHDISLREELCLDLIGEVMLKMNSTLYFNQDAPDEDIVEDWDCCRIKLCEVGSLMEENKNDIKLLCDDLKMSKFLIESNQEEYS